MPVQKIYSSGGHRLLKNVTPLKRNGILNAPTEQIQIFSKSLKTNLTNPNNCANARQIIQERSKASVELLPNSNKKFQCYVCALEFNEPDILSIHLENVHDLGAKIKIEKLGFYADSPPSEGN